MRGLISAIQFFTILPLRGSRHFEPGAMAPFFPVVGLIIGILLSVLDWAAIRFWSVSVASVLDVLFLAVLTGALHLDGVGDTADGLFSHRDKSEALRIMKDSRIGVMGLVAVVAVLAVKWAGMSEIQSHRRLLLVLVPAYARAGMLLGMRFLPYGRPDGGTGRPFFRERPGPGAFLWLGIPVALSLFLGWAAVALNGFFLLITAAVLLFYRHRLGCITGDMLGAMSETTEALLFLSMSMGALQ